MLVFCFERPPNRVGSDASITIQVLRLNNQSRMRTIIAVYMKLEIILKMATYSISATYTPRFSIRAYITYCTYHHSDYIY